ncbi:MAG: spondin domain-containing protein [Solirubrobacterales bacterium]
MVRTTRRLLVAAMAVGLAGLALAPAALGRDYDVTITNLTSGQPLTPPVAATHHGKHAVFEVGAPASVGVREIAENGNSAPLLAQLEADPFGEFFDFTESASGPLVPPGVPGDAMFDQQVTLELAASPRAKRLSFVSMLICTNDGFTGLDGLKLPSPVGKSKTVVTDGYDAHTEINTEDYADIVPPCQGLIGDSSGEPGTGTSDPALAEGGVIAHHAGIQGGSDLEPAIHGWTDPVAEVRVERTG